tara:strand:- start:64 stop:972 length:909 start_codon:yes stop_codon:yes gene_type:complete
MNPKYIINRLIFRFKNYGFLNTLKKSIEFFFQDKKINLDLINLPNNEKLENIFLRFGTDKANLDGKKTFYKIYKNINTRKKYYNYESWINREDLYNFEYEMGLNYRPIYEKYFTEIKNKELKILEIGVAGGHSLASWYCYFKKSKIFGIDIKNKSYLQYSGRRLFYDKLDCLNNEQVNEYINNHGEFDIIIDDSYHDHPFFELNIKNFFKTLKSGGLYFLEDFKDADDKLKIIRDYNFKNNTKLTSYNLTMYEIFNFIKNKKQFDHEILDKNFNEYLFTSVKNLTLHYPGHPSASLCVLEKI